MSAHSSSTSVIASPNLLGPGRSSSGQLLRTPLSTSTPLSSARRPCSETSKISQLTATLSPSSRTNISEWGLPTSITEKYGQRGIFSMFPWQVECLCLDGVLAGKNLVYSAPTSAGKTLVAELLMLKSVVDYKKKALFIVPYISLAREKMHHLHNLVQDEGIKVGGFMGSHSPAGGLQAIDIAICTIEKANSLVNRLLEENQLAQLRIVVVDELHLLSDSHRGYLLELLLTKLLYMSRKSTSSALQIIGMSATLPNLPLLAQWLDSAFYKTDFRPVPLAEYIKIDQVIYNSEFIPVKTLKPVVPLQNDSDLLVNLCLETLLAGHSVLVFCPSKAWCEKLAENVASEFFSIGKPADRVEGDSVGSIRSELRSQLVPAKLVEVLEHLKRCPAGLDPVLARTIRFGVAFHHAGLTMEERDIIEGSFRSGAIRVLVATSTLSSGVNLPARRVIVRSAFFQGCVIDALAYRQMIGRAGRQGVDSEGESILICQAHERKQVEMLVKSELKPVQSCLAKAGDETVAESMKRAILEVIASRVATKPVEVAIYANCTLLAASWREADPDRQVSDSLITSCVQFLEKNEFVRLQEIDDTEDIRYVATQLGQACLVSALSPDESLLVFSELEKARRSFSLESDLHVIYQVTPIYMAKQWTNMDWLAYLTLWEHLSPELKRVGELVGVEERFLIRAMKGNVNFALVKQAKQHAIHVRFYIALALHDLVNEVPLPTVTEKYGCNKGFLQNLQQQAATFAGMVKAFCSKLGWHSLTLLLDRSQERLQFGVQRELCDLVRLPCLDGQRARLLFNAGFESVASLAAALPMDVEVALRRAIPFESARASDGETVYEVQQRQSRRMVWITGSRSITESEAARMIVSEAQELLRRELGLKDLLWEKQKSQCTLPTKEIVPHNSPVVPSIPNISNVSEASPDLLQSSHRSSKKSLRISSSRSLTRLSSSLLSTSKASRNSSHSFNKTPALISKPKDVGVTPDLFDSNSTVDGATSFDSFQLDSQALLDIQKKENLYTKRHSVSTSLSLPPPSKRSRSGSPATSPGLKPLEVPESEDLFPEKSPSQPKTPYYDICTEELVFSSKLSNQSNITLNQTPSLIDSPKNSNRPLTNANQTPSLIKSTKNRRNSSRSVLKSPNSVQCSKNLSYHEDTLSDSYFEAVFQTYFNENSPAKLALRFEEEEDEESCLSRMRNLDFPNKIRSPPVIKEPSPISPKQRLPSKIQNKAHELAVVAESQDLITETPIRTRKTQVKTTLKTSKFDSPELVEATPQIRSRSLRGNKTEPPLESSTKLTVLMRQSKRKILPKDKTTRLVEVDQTEDSYDTFLKNWSQSCLSAVTLVFETNVLPPKTQIGARVSRRSTRVSNKELGFRIGTSDQVLVGVAVRWDTEKDYYVSFKVTDTSADIETVAMRFAKTFQGCKQCLMWGAAKQMRALHRIFGININIPTRVYDLETALWLMDPESEDISFFTLMASFAPEFLLEQKKINNNSMLAFEKALWQSKILYSAFPAVRPKLEDLRLWDSFEREMLSMCCLVGLELNGLGFDRKTAEKLRIVLENKLEKLTTRAHHLAGRSFRLSSLDDVSKVLYKELGLSKSGSRMCKNRKQIASVSKEALLRLVDTHPLPQVVLDWRKVNSALYKVLFPLSKVAERNVELRMERIYGECQFFSATGRVSMREPNLQSIPRDFTIKSIEELSEEVISMRKAFIPRKGAVLLAADYSQLELRILAFMANETKLKTILNGKGDVFKLVAAKWKNVDESQVTAALRQQAKQVCYGMIYGIGHKALGEQLGLDEAEAAIFMETFKKSYKGIDKFLQETVRRCRELGYVETLLHRRRYLPAIQSSQVALRSQAERQAVNTTIQGSAADIVKAAMVKIEEQLRIAFPNSVSVLPGMSLRHYRSRSEETRGANLVLQLHDELLYEVAEEDLVQVAQIVKINMEKALPLDVLLPVVLKSGCSWGSLTVFEL